MSRTRAKKVYTVEDQIKATEGVECRKDANVIDEIPMAYRDIDAVMIELDGSTGERAGLVRGSAPDSRGAPKRRPLQRADGNHGV